MTNFLATAEFWMLIIVNVWRLRTRRTLHHDIEVLYYRKLRGEAVVLSVRTRETDRRRFFFRAWNEDLHCDRCGLNFANRDQFESLTHSCTLQSTGAY